MVGPGPDPVVEARQGPEGELTRTGPVHETVRAHVLPVLMVTFFVGLLPVRGVEPVTDTLEPVQADCARGRAPSPSSPSPP